MSFIFLQSTHFLITLIRRKRSPLTFTGSLGWCIKTPPIIHTSVKSCPEQNVCRTPSSASCQEEPSDFWIQTRVWKFATMQRVRWGLRQRCSFAVRFKYFCFSNGLLCIHMPIIIIKKALFQTFLVGILGIDYAYWQRELGFFLIYIQYIHTKQLFLHLHPHIYNSNTSPELSMASPPRWHNNFFQAKTVETLWHLGLWERYTVIGRTKGGKK